MQCPYCLQSTEQNLVQDGTELTYKCTKCSEKLHRNLLDKKMIRRISVGLVGFSGHGKTVFITSLFYTIRNLVRSGLWPDNFIYESLDDNTLQVLHEQVPAFEKSELPPGTPQNFPKPAVIEFERIPSYGNRFINFYDVAGGVFEQPSGITQNGRYVASSDIVFFVISLPDCGSNLANTSERLLQTYIQAVYNRLHINLKQSQHLIVVLTKGDSIHDLPSYLKDSLNQGACSNYRFSNLPDNDAAAQMQQCVEQLKTRSDYINKWLESRNCRGFCALAEARFQSVSYVLVSATGCEPVGEGERQMLPSTLNPNDPKCVLDPLLLALDKTNKVNFAKVAGKILSGVMGQFKKSSRSKTSLQKNEPSLSREIPKVRINTNEN